MLQQQRFGVVVSGGGVEAFIERRVGPARLVLAVPAVGRVADDREQPGSRVATLEPGEVTERAQVRLLDDVLGILGVPDQPTREVVGGVEVWKKQRR